MEEGKRTGRQEDKGREGQDRRRIIREEDKRTETHDDRVPGGLRAKGQGHEDRGA